MPHAGRREQADEPLPLLGRGGREALAQPAVARVDAELASGLGVDEAQLADIGELLLARVADLDRDASGGARRSAAAARASRAGRGSRRRSRRATAARRARRAAPAPRRASRCRPARLAGPRASAGGRGGPAEAVRQRGSSGPNAISPSRLPRRVAACPTASATPSATSALRRSAVPNAIDADESKTSHVTSTRSASSTRTWVRRCGR